MELPHYTARLREIGTPEAIDAADRLADCWHGRNAPLWSEPYGRYSHARQRATEIIRASEEQSEES